MSKRFKTIRNAKPSEVLKVVITIIMVFSFLASPLIVLFSIFGNQ